MNSHENATGPAGAGPEAMDTEKAGEAYERSIGGRREATRAKTSRLFAWRKAVVAADLSSTQKLVALALSLHMDNGGGSCFPSQETIAAETSLGIRAVRDAVKALSDGGFIARTGGRHRGDVTHYTATLPSERRQHVPASEAGTRQHVPPSIDGKAAPDDTEGGTSIHERRHDVPTRTTGGRPEDVLRNHEDADALARDARSGSTWEVVSIRREFEPVETFATEAEAISFAGDDPDLFARVAA